MFHNLDSLYLVNISNMFLAKITTKKEILCDVN